MACDLVHMSDTHRHARYRMSHCDNIAATRAWVRCTQPMAEITNWAFPPELQPSPDEVRFDLEAAMNAVVGLRAEIPDEAFTAGILGTERIGNGVVIRADGLVLTIGYLITEAQ